MTKRERNDFNKENKARLQLTLFLFGMSLAPASFETFKVQLDISYKIKGENRVFKNELLHPQDPFETDAVQVHFDVSRHTDNQGGYLLGFTIKALQSIELIHFNATFLADLQNQAMLANGFQNWSQAREFDKRDRISAIPSSVSWYTQFNLQG